MRRREFLTLSAASVGGLLVYTLQGEPLRISGEEKPLRIPLRFFTREEALLVAAATARIFPSDESGPGAREANVTVYIDRQLAGPYGRDAHRYTHPPFEESEPEFGYQGKATPREIYREGLKELEGFDRLSAQEQDRRLQAMEDSVFFRLLRTHTIEGMFCDPVHGGNAGMIGWQLIGYPGPRMSNAGDVETHYGQAFRPKPVNLEQLSQAFGRPYHPSEDGE
ncbi:MAG TPA: gluconate 2-dehydrogenase subunit 3 family protein [Terriglobales bacterium]|nr:gluconate 2-dehydrogenase subunit 3 family protein [Terriglobales bacterium]